MEFSMIESGRKAVKKKVKDIKSTFWIISPITVLVYYAEFFTLSDNHTTKIAYFLILLPVQTILIGLLIWVILTSVKDINSTIKMINFSEDNITVVTHSILWKKIQSITISIEDNINLKKDKIKWMEPKKELETMIVKLTTNKKYYLIKDYFEDYEEILKKLTTREH